MYISNFIAPLGIQLWTDTFLNQFIIAEKAAVINAGY